MSASAVVHTNLIDSSTIITSNTEDADWPLENLFDKIAAKRFLWTAVGSNWIEFDFGSSQSFDTIAIINHDGTAITCTIKGDNSTPPTTTLATPAHRAGELWAPLGSVSARYVRVEVTGILGIGQIVIGTRVELPRGHRFGKIPGRQRDDIYHETQGGIPQVSHLYTREIREYTWTVLESELENFATVDSVVLGRTLPYVWIPDTGYTASPLAGDEVIYCRNLEAHYRPAERSDPITSFEDPLYDVSWKLIQESYGLELAS